MQSNIKHSGTLSGQEFKKGRVCKDAFWKVVMDRKAYKNNSKDKKMRHFKPSEIVNRAESKIGEVGYNLIFKNCEHFASWCRYDRELSYQADGLLTGLAVAVAVGVTGLLAVLVAWFRSGKKKDKAEESEH